jgi:hypothetical protein
VLRDVNDVAHREGGGGLSQVRIVTYPVLLRSFLSSLNAFLFPPVEGQTPCFHKQFSRHLHVHYVVLVNLTSCRLTI